MTKNQLLKLLRKFPDDAEIYVRHGNDDAYPAKPRIFNDEPPILYFEADFDRADDHLNFPENYSGTKEITNEFLSAKLSPG